MLAEAPRVEIATIEKDITRSGSRYARRLMRVVVRPKVQPMPGGYLCNEGENVIAVPENQVAAVRAMAATDTDREDMIRAKRRFAEDLAKAQAEGIGADMVGFSVESIFREVSGHDYPALESAEFVEGVDALPPERLMSEERAQAAATKQMVDVVKAALFSDQS